MKAHRIHIVLTTILFAILLWFSVSMSDHYQVQVSAPLVVLDVPPGKAISSPLPRTVRLTFSDYGWKLVKLMWGPSMEWRIDLNAVPWQHHALTLRDLTEQFGGRLGVQPTSMYPESLFISLDTMVVKRVPVVPRYELAFREGFGQVGRTVVTPESVAITGALRLVGRIQTWPTALQRFSDVRQDIDATVPLSDSIPSFRFAPDRVRISLNVQQFAEKTFPSVPIELMSTPQNREVLLGSPRITLVVRGGIEQLASLRQSNIRVVVDYRDILADTSGIIEPQVSVPSGLRIVKKTPERIQYVVRKK